MTSGPSVWVQHVLPQRLLSRAIYRLARSPRPWIKAPLIRWFTAQYRVDLEEAESSDIDTYSSFNAFFTRALKAGARPLEGDDATLIVPVDGRLTEHGRLQEGTLLQAKGRRYSVEALLGQPLPPTLAGAYYATLYLAPRDYHRVHMPLGGRLLFTRYIPGKRYSVNAATVRGVRNLFCLNERVVCGFETRFGSMILVLVGALNVSSISTVWLGEIKSGAAKLWTERDVPSRYLRRGEECARFNLGSTVIVLLPGEGVRSNPQLAEGGAVQLGQALAAIESPAAGRELA
jgi:phosphatidylserine decarboxylase